MQGSPIDSGQADTARATAGETYPRQNYEPRIVQPQRLNGYLKPELGLRTARVTNSAMFFLDR